MKATADHVAQVEELADSLLQSFGESLGTRTLVIAGSGLGGFARGVVSDKSVSYGDLPHVGASTVAGHAGSLAHGTVGSGQTSLFLMNGRRHLYEGIGAQDATVLLRAVLSGFPAVQNVVISNAAGGLNPVFEVGDLMLISDHINCTNRNPLIGRNEDQWGDRFPDLSDVYSRELRLLAREAASEAKISLREGVYLAGHGPSYETRAEAAMLRNVFGADAVGMSTVPEALVCAHMGRRALGISFISNMLTTAAVTSHEEVMENSKAVEKKFGDLVTALVAKL